MGEVKRDEALDEEFHGCHSEGRKPRACEADIPTGGMQTLASRHIRRSPSRQTEHSIQRRW